MRSDALFRPATPADAAAIGRVSVASWQSTYRGIFPDTYLDGLDAEQRGRPWAVRLATIEQRPLEHVLVVELAGIVVGFSAIGPSPADPSGAIGEVWSIYLAPEVIGQGIGSRLFDGAVSALGERGFREAVLWVAEANARARRFYERHGWVPDGATKVDGSFGHDITEVRYQTRLS